MKKCKNCGVEKSTTEFNKHTNSKDKLTYDCKECQRKKALNKYYAIQSDPEKLALRKKHRKEYMQKYKQNNEDKYKESQRKYKEKHKEYIKLKQKEYRDKNKEKILIKMKAQTAANFRKDNPFYAQEGFVYFIKELDRELPKVKIGWANNVKRRFKELLEGPSKIALWGAIKTIRYYEKYAQEKLMVNLSHGEWFWINDNVKNTINQWIKNKGIT